jgi:hypothetical protein
MSGLWSFFRNVRARWGDDGEQMDALLPDDTPVHVLRSDVGFHVLVGDIENDIAPSPVDGDDVMSEIFRQWFGGA